MFLLKLLVYVAIGLGTSTSSSKGGFCRVKIHDIELVSEGDCVFPSGGAGSFETTVNQPYGFGGVTARRISDPPARLFPDVLLKQNPRENSVLKELNAELEERRLKAIKCKSPPSMTNGAAIGCDDNKGIDGVCTLECNAGYLMSGSATATCKDDLDGNSEGRWDTGDSACSDIDECASAAENNCHADATCTNSIGSFTCACNSGYFGNGVTCNAMTCTSPPSITNGAAIGCDVGKSIDDECTLECNAGYSMSGSATATCKDDLDGNSEGSWNTGDSVCSDVDECASAADNNCHANATCTNNIGSFTCVCNSGYSGSGITCVVLEPCAGMRYENKCFIAIALDRPWLDYAGAVAECKRNGGLLGNLYSQSHMDDVMKYIRENVMRGTFNMSFRVGLKFDPLTSKLTYRGGNDGPVGLKWYRGYPLTGPSYSRYTNMILRIEPPYSTEQYLNNYPPTHRQNVICEIE